MDAEERRQARELRRAAEQRANEVRRVQLAERKEMTTYRNADGSYVGDEYAHVGELEYWDDADEPVMVIGERWVLAERWQVEVPQAAVDLRDALIAEAAEEED